MDNSDRVAFPCQLYQPTVVCVEFDNVAYLADYHAASLKITSILSHTATFLEVDEKRMEKRFDNFLHTI